GRAAAFEGSDGEPYTVAIETEPAEDGSRWAGYLVFLRWSQTGSAVMGHLETGDLASGQSEAEARSLLEALPLQRVREILNDEIARRGTDSGDVWAAVRRASLHRQPPRTAGRVRHAPGDPLRPG